MNWYTVKCTSGRGRGQFGEQREPVRPARHGNNAPVISVPCDPDGEPGRAQRVLQGHDDRQHWIGQSRSASGHWDVFFFSKQNSIFSLNLKEYDFLFKLLVWEVYEERVWGYLIICWALIVKQCQNLKNWEL